MKPILKIKKWELIRVKQEAEALDLTGESFITVGKRALRRAPHKTVALPNGVCTIKAEAFAECAQLERLVLPEQNAVGLSCGVFRDCAALQTVVHSERISAIGDSAFENCISLQNLVVDKGLRRIGDEAFRGCRALRHFTVPSKSTVLGKAAFRDCISLEGIAWDAQAQALSEELFRGCRALRDVTIPEALTEIPNGTFRECEAMEELSIPASVRTIGKDAFLGCTALKSVTLALGVESIGANAFANTPSLREVYLPHSVKRLGKGAFGCEARSGDDRVKIYVENEYMEKRMIRLLSKCGSAVCADVVVVGKTIAERKRERRRATLEDAPVHLWDVSEEK